jgi:peptide/nickel transport system ATP-binding protein/oligopeptide transport system ATP-binding protein
MIEVKGLTKVYRSGMLGREQKKALDNVSFTLQNGETLGIIGESGCGKSTLSLILAKLLEATSGSVSLNGQDVSALKGKELKAYHKQVQIIFQNPETALDPRMKIEKCILEAIRNYDLAPRRSEKERQLLEELISMVGLQKEHLSRYCWELSGGQIQRAVLARVIALEPELLIADEPTSMLDVSVQAQILSLIKDLQKRLDFAMLFISHDLDVVRAVSDRVIVIRHGVLIEEGPTEEVYEHPQQPYTRDLLDAFYYDKNIPGIMGEGEENCF